MKCKKTPFKLRKFPIGKIPIRIWDKIPIGIFPTEIPIGIPIGSYRIFSLGYSLVRMSK